MDHIVGDDIAIGIRQVVRQLLNLASDPDSQVLMARQPEFISGLINYMSEEDQEVRLMAARAIEFLSTHPNNKEIVANYPGLVEKMKEFAISDNEHARAISRRTLNNVRSFLSTEDLDFVKEHPINNADNTKQIVNVIKTYNFSVDALDLPYICESLQNQIIQLPGVTSVTLEKPKKRVVVTVRQTEEEKKEEEIRAVIEYNFKIALKISRILSSNSLESTTIDDDGYVDEVFSKEEEGDQALSMYGFNSIESRLEKKKQEREAKQKKEKKMSWLFGKVSKAMSSWW